MYNFILNPTAGKGKPVNNMDKIEEFLNKKKIAYKIHKTLYPFHAIELAKTLSSNGSENIIAVGGDGTVNEVLNGISDLEKCNLGIIPSGTGNDFSKFINLPNDPIKAMEVILNSTPQYTDYLILNNEKKVLNVTGMGMDVTVLERCKRMKLLKGKFQYIISLIITLLKFKWYNFKVSVDGKQEKDKTVMLIAACNGKYFGGGIPVSPKSDISDNYINLIIINKMSKWKIPFCLISFLRGNFLQYKFAENILCKEISIKYDNPYQSTNIDGELYKYIPFECKLVKNMLKVYRA